MKTVVITGASRGIGAATAELFAQNGYTVAVNYNHNREKAELLVQKIREQGGTAFAVQADVSDREQVKRMADSVYTQCPTVDVLIHNAGIADEGLITEMTDERWQRMMGVHLDGAFYCTQAFLPQMIKWLLEQSKRSFRKDVRFRMNLPCPACVLSPLSRAELSPRHGPEK